MSTSEIMLGTRSGSQQTKYLSPYREPLSLMQLKIINELYHQDPLHCSLKGQNDDQDGLQKQRQYSLQDEINEVG
jgi:hypothetical protein